MSKAEDVGAQVAKARANLETTLDEIEEKFNVPKRAKELGKRAQASYASNRTPWIVGATGVAIAILGVIAWAVFSGDDD